MKITSVIKFILLFVVVCSASTKAAAQPRGVIPPVKSTSTYRASSYLPSSYGIYYTPSLAGDAYLNTWWSPASYDRETCWLQIDFSATRLINKIDIHAGSHYPSFKNLGNLYPKNLRIRFAQLEFSDGDTELIDLDDVDRIQTVYFSSRRTRYVRIRPLRYYAATKWNDPCISHFIAGYE